MATVKLHCFSSWKSSWTVMVWRHHAVFLLLAGSIAYLSRFISSWCMPPGCTKNPLCQLADGWDQSQGIWGSLNVEVEQGFPITSTSGVLVTPTKLKNFSCGSPQSSLVSNHLYNQDGIIFRDDFEHFWIHIKIGVINVISYQYFLKTNIKDPNAPRCGGSEFPRPYKSSVVCPSCTGEWMQCTLGP